MRPPSPALRVAAEIIRVLKESPDNPDALQKNPKFNDTFRGILEMDTQVEERGDLYMAPGSDAFETAKRFTEIHVKEYRENGRPSLPALAIHHAEALGIDRNSPEYKAMILVAVRAEMKAAVTPDYHSQFHFMDVAAMTATFLAKNNDMIKEGIPNTIRLSKEEQALTFIAAIGHDLDHDGRGNPKDNPLLNEEKSFQLMLPLLKEAGLAEMDIHKIHTILLTTSPNGPHAVLKAVAHAHREGGQVDFDAFNAFPELKVLAHDKHLSQMAAIVSDADLYASGGAGLDSNKVMSELLTSEVKKSGANMDLTTDGARKFFLDNIVGEGFASDAGRAIANETLDAMRTETTRRLAAAQKPPANKS